MLYGHLIALRRAHESSDVSFRLSGGGWRFEDLMCEAQKLLVKRVVCLLIEPDRSPLDGFQTGHEPTTSLKRFIPASPLKPVDLDHARFGPTR